MIPQFWLGFLSALGAEVGLVVFAVLAALGYYAMCVAYTYMQTVNYNRRVSRKDPK